MTQLERGGGLVDHLASTLRQRILTGQLAAGVKLPSESELMAEFGVGRGVVREAVARLRAAGVVETHRGSGSYVLAATEPGHAARFEVATAQDLAHLMELRIAVEADSAALAAQRLTASTRASLRAAMAGFAALPDHPERIVAADFAFHLAVAEASGNRYIVELLTSIGPRAIMLHRSQLGEHDAAADPEHLRLLTYEHQAVHDAVQRGDADGARAAMRSHLRRSLAALG